MTAHLPLDFPGLQEEARRLNVELLSASYSAHGPPAYMANAQARLLADLARPESQSFWLRALATRCGQSLPTVGAPLWVRHGYGKGPDGIHSRFLTLAAQGWEVYFHDHPDGTYLGCVDRLEHRIKVAGIRGCKPTPEGDIEAFRLVTHAVFKVTP